MNGYTWDDLRSHPASDLSVGDVLVNPSTGTAYRVSSDGHVKGVGWLPLDGTVWTVTVREGDLITAVSSEGSERTESIPPHAQVLKILKSRQHGRLHRHR